MQIARRYLYGLCLAVLSSPFVNPSPSGATGVPAAYGEPERPNILWITSEDNGRHLGCYGDPNARTPHLDALAARSLRYDRAWSNAPVCAPARTAIITGLYPTSTGGQHMRSFVPLPDHVRMFPCYLRDAGYWTSNCSKKDYNHPETGQVWDMSGGKAHWRRRAEGQPFFSVFNFTTTHESQIRKRPHQEVLDPAQVRVPAYHPDHPDVRRDWAQYHDKMTRMDAQAGELLDQLEEDGLAEDTIVFYYGDHGPGMPRCKRWPFDSGLGVPLLVHVPERWEHLAPEGYEAGAASSALVAFVDLAPTVLSLVGLDVPRHMQGRAFAGWSTAPARDYSFGFRGRMDERVDLVRAVQDGRYVYLRHFHPQRIYGQYLDYMFQTPTTRVWRALFDAGELDEVRSRFWQVKPSEELYDLEQDPDEVENLAGSEQHATTVARMRTALREHVLSTGDLGFLSELEMHARAGDGAPWQLTQGEGAGELETAFEAAWLATERASAPESVRSLLDDDDAAVRYWGVIGADLRGPEEVSECRERLVQLLEDDALAVRIASAEALGRHGGRAGRELAFAAVRPLCDVSENPVLVTVAALCALDSSRDGITEAEAEEWREVLADLPRKRDGAPRVLRNYVPRLIERLRSEL